MNTKDLDALIAKVDALTERVATLERILAAQPIVPFPMFPNPPAYPVWPGLQTQCPSCGAWYSTGSLHSCHRWG
jgi:hypothetical protein